LFLFYYRPFCLLAQQEGIKSDIAFAEKGIESDIRFPQKGIKSKQEDHSAGRSFNILLPADENTA